MTTPRSFHSPILEIYDAAVEVVADPNAENPERLRAAVEAGEVAMREAREEREAAEEVVWGSCNS